MKPRSDSTSGLATLLRISLLTVFLLVSCAPTATPDSALSEVPAEPLEPVTVEPQAPPPPTETVAPVSPTDSLPTETPALELPQVVATSRGPNLEATDPGTYTRASGELQLVEFFAFW